MNEIRPYLVLDDKKEQNFLEEMWKVEQLNKYLYLFIFNIFKFLCVR